MEIEERERPVSLQIFGSEPDLMAEIAKRIEHRNFDILDINMGCPVPKVVNNGEGSALMKKPELVHEIVYKVSHAIEKPVTVKIRKGFTEDAVNAVEIAKIAEEAGAAAVAVHGRTREQYYAGHPGERLQRQPVFPAENGVADRKGSLQPHHPRRPGGLVRLGVPCSASFRWAGG